MNEQHLSGSPRRADEALPWRSCVRQIQGYQKGAVRLDVFGTIHIREGSCSVSDHSCCIRQSGRWNASLRSGIRKDRPGSAIACTPAWLLPKSMDRRDDFIKAVQMYGYGGIDQLRYEDVRDPKPSPDEVLVKVFATSVNPIDWKIRRGDLKDLMPHRQPPSYFGGGHRPRDGMVACFKDDERSRVKRVIVLLSHVAGVEIQE
jgi:hypothetical protein